MGRLGDFLSIGQLLKAQKDFEHFGQFFTEANFYIFTKISILKKWFAVVDISMLQKWFE